MGAALPDQLAPRSHCVLGLGRLAGGQVSYLIWWADSTACAKSSLVRAILRQTPVMLEFCFQFVHNPWQKMTCGVGRPRQLAKGSVMVTRFFWAGCAALTLSCVASAAFAGPISSACMASNRNAANARLCSCIQQVADVTLEGADQRRAATFFRDPDKAQKVHMSTTHADDAFWDRYVTFGQQAEASCSG